jgi:hypothetical protein
LVRQGGKATGKPVGMMIQIDGRMRHMIEFTALNASGLPKEVRMVQLDSAGRLSSEYTVDLSRVSLNRRLAAAEQTMFRRLLRGGANLVLPDVLQAQQVEDDPCAGLEQGRVLAAAALATLAAGLNVVAAGCNPITGIAGCPTFAAALAAVAIATGVFLYFDVEFDKCRAKHESCFEGGYMTNGSCDLPNTGGSGRGGEGGEGGEGGGGGGRGFGGGVGGGGGGHDINCMVYTIYTWTNGWITGIHTYIQCI